VTPDAGAADPSPFGGNAGRGLRFLTASLVWMFACAGSPSAPLDVKTASFDFARSTEGWVAGFADYPFGWEGQMELVADHRSLPAPLDPTRGGLFIAGSNHSDDLFMFWKRRVDGLRADRTYAVELTVEFATNMVSGFLGGEVFVKVGATTVEPVAVLVGRDYRMNVDKGNQSQGGKDALVVGTARTMSGTDTWEVKELRSAPNALVVTPGADGSVWLLVGTDSGCECRASLYYTRVMARFTTL